MAWPYANGPLHLGHVAGNCLPADIQYKYERARGRKVLMCSGSDEHGTPITLTAEQEGVSPQEIVDRFHEINTKSLADLGCSWVDNVDPRGVEFGGALYNRTSDPSHKEIVREVFLNLLDSGFLEKTTMQQYCSITDGQVRFLLTDMLRAHVLFAMLMGLEEINAMIAAAHMRPMNYSILYLS